MGSGELGWTERKNGTYLTKESMRRTPWLFAPLLTPLSRMSASVVSETPVKVVLGTMSYGGQTSKAVAKQQLEYFLSQGHSHIDTARMYGHGKTEEIIGEILQESPALKQAFLIDSKVNAFPDYNKNLHPDNVLQQFESISNALQKDSINVLYLHAPGINSYRTDTISNYHLT